MTAFEVGAREDLARELAADREATWRSEYSVAGNSVRQAEEDRMTNDERLRTALLTSEEYYQGEAAVCAAGVRRNLIEQSERQAQAEEATTSLNEMRAALSLVEFKLAEESARKGIEQQSLMLLQQFASVPTGGADSSATTRNSSPPSRGNFPGAGVGMAPPTAGSMSPPCASPHGCGPATHGRYLTGS